MVEKVDSIKKTNKLQEVLSSKLAKNIVGTVLFSALGVAIPRVFHLLVGAQAGVTFLPMHIMVLIAALTFGITSATVVAGSSVVFSYLLTGMPALARMPYMLVELVIYAVLLGLLNKKFNSYVSLVGTMVIGRILYAGVLFVAVNMIGLNGYGISVIESTKAGFLGIIIQLAIVPVIAMLVKKGIKLND